MNLAGPLDSSRERNNSSLAREFGLRPAERTGQLGYGEQLDGGAICE